jgi:hypothetical protein
MKEGNMKLKQNFGQKALLKISPLGRLRQRWDNNIQTDLVKIVRMCYLSSYHLLGYDTM